MNLLKWIKFERGPVMADTSERPIKFMGELVESGLNSYITYDQIRDAIIKEIVDGLKGDIGLRIEALKPEIAKIIIEKNKL